MFGRENSSKRQRKKLNLQKRKDSRSFASQGTSVGCMLGKPSGPQYSFLTMLTEKSSLTDGSSSLLHIHGGMRFSFGLAVAMRVILVLLGLTNHAFLRHFFLALPILLKSFILV